MCYYLQIYVKNKEVTLVYISIYKKGQQFTNRNIIPIHWVATTMQLAIPSQ